MCSYQAVQDSDELWQRSWTLSDGAGKANSNVLKETEPGVEVEKGVAASVHRRVGGVV